MKKNAMLSLMMLINRFEGSFGTVAEEKNPMLSMTVGQIA